MDLGDSFDATTKEYAGNSFDSIDFLRLASKGARENFSGKNQGSRSRRRSERFELSGDVFRKNIGLEVDFVPLLECSEGRYGQGMGDKSDAKGKVVCPNEGQANPVDGDGAFGCHLLEEVDWGGEFDETPLVFFAYFGDGSEPIDVSCNIMTSEPLTDLEAAFAVDFVTDFDGAEGGF
jgi:hypothetical protein